jgi:phage shock protein A
MLEKFVHLNEQKRERVRKRVAQLDESIAQLSAKLGAVTSLDHVYEAQDDVTKIQNIYKMICSAVKNK